MDWTDWITGKQDSARTHAEIADQASEHADKHDTASSPGDRHSGGYYGSITLAVATVVASSKKTRRGGRKRSRRGPNRKEVHPPLGIFPN
jgi:hypothetical protein